MLGKILKWTLYLLLAAAASAYLFFSGKLSAENRGNEVCRSVFVCITDKDECGFVTAPDVIKLIKSYSSNPIGQQLKHLNTDAMESLLSRRSAVKESQVYITPDGNLHIILSQRKPILRIETANGGFYVDDKEFIFPLEKSYTSYVPVITGYIPISVTEDRKKILNPEGSAWIKNMTEFGNFLSKNEFWGDQIEQIYIDRKGDLILIPRKGPKRIVFGDATDIQGKFKKLYSFYSRIVPYKGWERYSEVNLKFKSQIVCTKEKK